MTPRDPLTVRPIRFTDDVAAWRTILKAMGAVPLSEHPGWLVYQLGAGRLALHTASDSSRPAGTTALGLETSVPLAEVVPAAAAEGVDIELSDTDHGESGVVTADDGTTVTIDAPTPDALGLGAPEPGLSVMPVWHTPDMRVALRVLDGLGLQRRVTKEDGSWADLTLRSGGLHGVHPRSDVAVELTFELNGHLEHLQESLEAAGVEAEIHDEPFGRSLRITDPDGGKPVRVTEKPPDLYSYALSEM